MKRNFDEKKAYPVCVDTHVYDDGISLRDYYTIKILSSMVENGCFDILDEEDQDQCITVAYRMADKMMVYKKQEIESKENN